jgi:hypothetical protein
MTLEMLHLRREVRCGEVDIWKLGKDVITLSLAIIVESIVRLIFCIFRIVVLKHNELINIWTDWNTA